MIAVFTTRAPSLTLTLLKRELLTGLRSWKSFLLLLALLGLLYSTAFYAMNAASMNYIFMSGAMRSLFSMQVFAVGAIVFAVIPALAAVSINSERQDENYDMLLTTLITPRRIVLGKFAAVLIRALLIAIAVLPFTGVVYFYAGVDVESFFNALAVLLPAALCNTAVGLWCSNAAPRPARSIFLTFGMIVLLTWLIPASAAVYYNVPNFQHAEPFVSLAALIARHPFEAYVLYQLLLCALFLLATLFPLRSILNPDRLRARAAALAPLQRNRVAARASRIPLVIIPDGANPLGYKDLCGSAFRNSSVALAAFIMTASAYGLLFYWIVSVSAELIMTIGILERILLLVLIPPMVAVLMVKEREETNFDMLRMTLLTEGSLVTGKILALMRLLKPVLLAILLCKFLVIVVIMTRTDHPHVRSAVFVCLPDFVLLPLHFVFVVLASLAGAALPKKLIPAICGASGFTFLASFALIFAQLASEPNAAVSNFDFAMTFVISNLLVTGVASIVCLGIGLAIVSDRWRYQGGTTHRTDASQTESQPPSLPK